MVAFQRLTSMGLVTTVLAGCGLAPHEVSTNEHAILTSPTPVNSPLPAEPTRVAAVITPTDPMSSLWLPGDPNWSWLTPTPLATPALAVGDARLRDWSETDALNLIQTAVDYAAENDELSWGESRPNYVHDQAAIEMAVREMLLRYPETPWRNNLEWRLALAWAIEGQSTGDAWILDEIEQALNEKQVTPKGLSAWLEPYGFQVSDTAVAPNLVGDGNDGQVLWITFLSDNASGLAAALIQHGDGRYALEAIHSNWDFAYGARETDKPFLIGDHTGDSLPEIAMQIGYHNGTMACGHFTYLYQWNGARFARLQPDLPRTDSCGFGGGQWAYGPPDEYGIATLEIRAIPDGSVADTLERYRWSSGDYVLADRQVAPPEDSAWLYNWLAQSIEQGHTQTVIDHLSAMLASGTPVSTESGERYEQYLAFQLGQALALQSRSDEAREAFRRAAGLESPVTESVGRAAQAYLDRYDGDQTLMVACQAALAVMADAAGDDRAMATAQAIGAIRTAWGYVPASPVHSICSLRAAFRHLVERHMERTPTAAAEALSQSGVAIVLQAEADLDGRGGPDLYLRVLTPGDDGSYQDWLLLSGEARLSAVALDTLAERAGLQITEPPSPVASVALTVTAAPDGVRVVRVNRDGHEAVWILEPEGVVTIPYIEIAAADVLGVEVEGSGWTLALRSGRSGVVEEKRWHWIDGALEPVSPTELGREAELLGTRSLFDTQDLPEALRALQASLTGVNVSAQRRYLFGLALELNGRKPEAARAYAAVIRAEPGGAFARLAAAKLGDVVR